MARARHALKANHLGPRQEWIEGSLKEGLVFPFFLFNALENTPIVKPEPENVNLCIHTGKSPVKDMPVGPLFLPQKSCFAFGRSQFFQNILLGGRPGFEGYHCGQRNGTTFLAGAGGKGHHDKNGDQGKGADPHSGESSGLPHEILLYLNDFIPVTISRP
jgi:hypothetical protein